MQSLSALTDIARYDEIALKHNAAYEAFKVTYAARNPAPPMPAVERGDWLVTLALVVMVLAAVIVSGSRTIAEFGGGLVGTAAFVMLELGIVAYAYIRTRKHYDEQRHASVKRLTNIGMGMAFVVALAANLHATLKGDGILLAAWLDTGILVLIAVSAPALALISGDLLGMEAVATSSRRRKAETAFTEAVRQWQEGLNRSWDSQKARWGVSVPVLAAVLSEQTDNRQTTRQTRPSNSGFTRTADGQRRVVEYLSQYPEDAAIPSRQLAMRIEQRTGVRIGHDTANKGRNAWRNSNAKE